MAKTISGIVLAGGRSERFGRDKCTYEYRGKALIQYSIDLLQGIVDELLIVTSSSAEDMLKAFGTTCVDDDDDSGPLAALITACSHVDTPAIFVLPCDMPFIRSDSIRKIVEIFQKERPGACVAVDTSGRVNPLVACYSTEIEENLREAMLYGNGSVYSVLQSLELVSTVLLSDSELTNINRQTDIP